MEGTSKPKKFALPRLYVRSNKTLDVAIDISEDLTKDDFIITLADATENLVEMQEELVEEIPTEVKKETGKGKGKKTKTERAPTAYNIFIKEMCEALLKTHTNMTPRERYALAIQMWKDRKVQV